MLAAMKTGRCVMFPFPANTAEGLANLLELSSSKVALASESHAHIWTEPLAGKPEIRLIKVPDLGSFVNEKSVEPYTYDRTWDEGTEDPQCLIQTSGESGILWPSNECT